MFYPWSILYFSAAIKFNKMKKLGIAFLLISLVACQQQKIGFVDNVELMDGYKEKTDIEDKYKKRADALTKKGDSLSKAIQIEYQDLQSKGLSQRKMQEQLGALQQKSQIVGQQFQQEEREIQLAGQTEMDSVIKKVKKEIKAYGAANGYTYILGGGEGGSVLYGKDTDDLTEEILKILNDNYNN